MKQVIKPLLILSAIFSMGCNTMLAQVNNIQTFAKLYGYVRWFYPGDEASKINWDKFAVYGVQNVEKAKDEKELKQILLDLFKPIAPALQIYESSIFCNFDTKFIIPQDTTGLKPVSWIHFGVELNTNNNKNLPPYDFYKSYRINKDSIKNDFTYATPKIGDHIKKNIGSNLSCLMPITLYGNKVATYPPSSPQLFEQLNTQINNLQDSVFDIQNKAVQLANIIIAWNVIQHFYPYFDVVNTDWEQELLSTIQNVYSAKNEAEYFKTVSIMMAHLNDGHCIVSSDNIKRWGLPFTVDFIENKIVITESMFPDYIVGDIVKSIDGKLAIDELLYQESLLSGSPQLKRYRGLNMFSADFDRSNAVIKVIRNGEEKELQCRRYSQYNIFRNPNRKLSSLPNLIDSGNSIIYLHGYSQNFNTLLPLIKEAKGLIVGEGFNLEWDLIPHIIKEPLWSTKWNVPITARPDRDSTTFHIERWQFKPKEPFINAKVVFINNPGRVSSGETIMGFIDHYKLAKTVGDTTAGTNGDINIIQLMGGYSIKWTGLRVLKHDGSQFQLIGFRPDYTVNRTIRAVKEGRDEYLEKAIEICKQ